MANWLSSLQVTQTQFISLIGASTLIIYLSIAMKPGGLLMWITVAMVSLCGLITSTWNLWSLKEHFTSFDHFWNLLNVRNIEYSTPFWSI